MLSLKNIVLAIISPIAFSFILLLVAVLLFVSKKNKLGKIFSICALGWLLLFSQPYTADLLLYPLEYKVKSVDLQAKNTPPPQFVAPLACYYQTNTTNPELSRWPECALLRMLTAKSIAEQYNAKLVVTGGNFLADKSVNYATAASGFFQAQGWSQEAIINTKKGMDTREELVALANVVGKQNFTIVTSATHVYRVRALAQDLELNASVFGANYVSGGKLTPYLSLPSEQALSQSKSALYEYVAILKYYIESV